MFSFFQFQISFKFQAFKLPKSDSQESDMQVNNSLVYTEVCDASQHTGKCMQDMLYDDDAQEREALILFFDKAIHIWVVGTRSLFRHRYACVHKTTKCLFISPELYRELRNDLRLAVGRILHVVRPPSNEESIFPDFYFHRNVSKD